MIRNELKSEKYWYEIRYNLKDIDTKYVTIWRVLIRNTLQSEGYWYEIRYNLKGTDTKYVTIWRVLIRNTLQSEGYWYEILYYPMDIVYELLLDASYFQKPYDYFENTPLIHNLFVRTFPLMLKLKWKLNKLLLKVTELANNWNHHYTFYDLIFKLYQAWPHTNFNCCLINVFLILHNIHC